MHGAFSITPGITPDMPYKTQSRSLRASVPQSARFCSGNGAYSAPDAMSIISTTTEHVSASTLRVRRYRERRREGVRCLTVEMYEADIAEAIARCLLKSDGDAGNVLDAWYASHLSDVALQWLVDNKVIKPEQRGDAGSILHSISAWLEQADR
jgi:hypothetical protein